MVFSFKGRRYLIVHIHNDEHLKERPFLRILKEIGHRFVLE